MPIQVFSRKGSVFFARDAFIGLASGLASALRHKPRLPRPLYSHSIF